MGVLSGPVAYLLVAWGVITSVLVILMVYRGTLTSREDDQMFLSQKEDGKMASEQRVLIESMNKLSRPLITLGVLSGTLFLVMASTWVYIGLKGS